MESSYLKGLLKLVQIAGHTVIKITFYSITHKALKPTSEQDYIYISFLYTNVHIKDCSKQPFLNAFSTKFWLFSWLQVRVFLATWEILCKEFSCWLLRHEGSKYRRLIWTLNGTYKLILQPCALQALHFFLNIINSWQHKCLFKLKKALKLWLVTEKNLTDRLLLGAETEHVVTLVGITGTASWLFPSLLSS